MNINYNMNRITLNFSTSFELGEDRSIDVSTQKRLGCKVYSNGRNFSNIDLIFILKTINRRIMNQIFNKKFGSKKITRYVHIRLRR